VFDGEKCALCEIHKKSYLFIVLAKNYFAAGLI